MLDLLLNLPHLGIRGWRLLRCSPLILELLFLHGQHFHLLLTQLLLLRQRLLLILRLRKLGLEVLDGLLLRTKAGAEGLGGVLAHGDPIFQPLQLLLQLDGLLLLPLDGLFVLEHLGLLLLCHLTEHVHLRHGFRPRLLHNFRHCCDLFFLLLFLFLLFLHGCDLVQGPLSRIRLILLLLLLRLRLGQALLRLAQLRVELAHLRRALLVPGQLSPPLIHLRLDSPMVVDELHVFSSQTISDHVLDQLPLLGGIRLLDHSAHDLSETGALLLRSVQQRLDLALVRSCTLHHVEHLLQALLLLAQLGDRAADVFQKQPCGEVVADVQARLLEGLEDLLVAILHRCHRLSYALDLMLLHHGGDIIGDVPASLHRRVHDGLDLRREGLGS
mmetsp:Transcript_29766/g.63347  ORF Transcript_29766/g.63347 Transcript_29766/m.63347 type:complete len:386 (-) Transcript_29766:19-1176(-)